MEEAILTEAKRLSIEYFGKETFQSIFFSNMLRTHAEHYCEDFLGENDFCHKFAIWQADYGFGENKEEMMDLNAGEIVVIPPNLPHEALMIGDVEEMDSWAPPRQDWLDGTDDYLREK